MSSYLMVFDACQGRVLVFCHDGGNENCSGVLLIVITLSFGPYGGTTIRMWSGKSRRCCNFFDSTFVGDQCFFSVICEQGQKYIHLDFGV